MVVESELETNVAIEKVSEDKLYDKIWEIFKRMSAFPMSLCLLINWSSWPLIKCLKCIRIYVQILGVNFF